MKAYCSGDIVIFNSAFCSESEKGRKYIVLESYDDVQRAKITPLDSTLSIPPVESVTYDMIEKV